MPGSAGMIRSATVAASRNGCRVDVGAATRQVVQPFAAAAATSSGAPSSSPVKKARRGGIIRLNVPTTPRRPSPMVSA